MLIDAIISERARLFLISDSSMCMCELYNKSNGETNYISYHTRWKWTRTSFLMVELQTVLPVTLHSWNGIMGPIMSPRKFRISRPKNNFGSVNARCQQFTHTFVPAYTASLNGGILYERSVSWLLCKYSQVSNALTDINRKILSRIGY